MISFFQPGKSIRLGKAENLVKFGENFSTSESEAQKILSRKINTLKHARGFLRSWIECARDLEVSATSFTIVVSIIYYRKIYHRTETAIAFSACI